MILSSLRSARSFSSWEAVDDVPVELSGVEGSIAIDIVALHEFADEFVLLGQCLVAENLGLILDLVFNELGPVLEVHRSVGNVGAEVLRAQGVASGLKTLDGHLVLEDGGRSGGDHDSPDYGQLEHILL